MKPFAAGRAKKGMKVHRLQSRAKNFGTIAYARPREALIRIEIDDQPVRMFGIVDPATPKMKLDRAELGQREVALGFRHGDECCATFLVRQVDRFNSVRKPLERVALVEAILQLTSRASEERDRPANKFRKHPVPHARIIQCEVQLRYAAVGEHLALGIG